MSGLFIFFYFRPKNEIAFSVLFILRPKKENHFTASSWVSYYCGLRLCKVLNKDHWKSEFWDTVFLLFTYLNVYNAADSVYALHAKFLIQLCGLFVCRWSADWSTWWKEWSNQPSCFFCDCVLCYCCKRCVQSELGFSYFGKIYCVLHRVKCPFWNSV